MNTTPPRDRQQELQQIAVAHPQSWIKILALPGKEQAEVRRLIQERCQHVQEAA